MEFLKANHFNSELGEYIRARNPYKTKPAKVIEKDLFLKYTGNDTGKLDDFIRDFDPRYKTPMLLKKYLSVNAEVLGFNIDPLFNYCLDALMILDLFEVPLPTIEGLAKEFQDQSLLEDSENNSGQFIFLNKVKEVLAVGLTYRYVFIQDLDAVPLDRFDLVEGNEK